MELLKRESKLKGLTLRALSLKLEVSETTIQEWVKGNCAPSPKNIIKLQELGFTDDCCINPNKEA